MPSHSVSVTGTVSAPAARGYAIIADYRDGHPRIIPKPPFGELIVEKGGVGAGTVIRFTMKIMGRWMTSRSEISEPEPGRVLVETDLDGKAVSTFIVEPAGDATKVTITTE